MEERDKVIVDPELRYPSEGLLGCEQQALRVLFCLRRNWNFPS